MHKNAVLISNLVNFVVNCYMCSAEYSSRSAHKKSKKKSSHKSDSDSDSKHKRRRSRSRSREKKNSGMSGQPVTALLLEERLKKKEDQR